MKQDKIAREKALFRYSVVSQVFVLRARGIGSSKAILEISKKRHLDPNGKLKTVSKRSLYYWVKDYKHGEFDGLFNNKKAEIEGSKSLEKKFEDFLIIQKTDDPEVSIPEIIKRAAKKKLIERKSISRTTVWRYCIRKNLPTTRVSLVRHKDMRRFSYKHRMQMVLCDGKHFKVGVKRKKRVAMIFLDDATRYALHGIVGTSESKLLFLRGLYQTIMRHGKMTILFVDNGSGFIAKDTLEICARLGITLIHGEAGYPEGHGKIERFNQTFKKQFLRYLDRSIEEDGNLGSLNLRVRTYLKEDYGKDRHETIKDTPDNRFKSDSRPLEFPASAETLKNYFILREKRKVSKDNIVKADGGYYEMPLGYASTTQEIRRQVIDQKYYFLHHGKLIELHSVDTEKNARTRRIKSSKPTEMTNALKGVSSAEMTYREKFAPVINSDGGFNKKEKKYD